MRVDDPQPFGLSVELPRLHTGGAEELADLGGVLNEVEGPVADDHSEGRAAVSMSVGEWPRCEVPGEGIEGLANAVSTPVDVAEQLRLGEHAGRVGEPQELADRWWWVPPLELAREVVVEADQGVVSENPRS